MLRSELYDFSNNEGFCNLFSTVFGRPMGKTESACHFDWEYIHNPNGRAIVFTTKNDNGDIVSAYPSLPLKMKIGSNSVKASLSFDSMTHPDYRGLRLFTKLGETMYQHLSNEGFSLTYGFPNKNILKLRTKYLQWFDVSDFPLMLRPLKWNPILKRFLRYSLLSDVISGFLNIIANVFYNIKEVKTPIGYDISALRKFDDRFDGLWKEIRLSYPICIERDSDYLNWRYSRPEEKYEILALEEEGDLCGYAVVKKEYRFSMTIGFLLDFIVKEPYVTAEYFFNFLIQRFKNMNVDLVSMLMTKSTPMYSIAKKCGFVAVPPKYQPQEIYFGARGHVVNDNISLIRNPRNWFISWGDTDLL